MTTKQINLKIPENLLSAVESYVKNYGFRNIQDLTIESIREKVFEKNKFDETFIENEIDMIDNLITKSIRNKDFISEKELFESLK